MPIGTVSVPKGPPGGLSKFYWCGACVVTLQSLGLGAPPTAASHPPSGGSGQGSSLSRAPPRPRQWEGRGKEREEAKEKESGFVA